jgi:hypothetical protein
VIVTAALTTGCDKEAERIARQAADRQAQQNTVMADLHKEVASGTRLLVEADGVARKDIVRVHQHLQAERSRLDSGRDALEVERQRIARDRRTQSLLTSSGTIAVTAVVVAMVLGFCWRALVSGRSDDGAEAQLNELLICEVLSGEPHASLGNDSSPSLLDAETDELPHWNALAQR